MRRAVCLWGAAQALCETFRFLVAPNEREESERASALARETLGEEAFAAAWEEGRAMSMEQAVAYTLEET
jgi:hypothetical protein